jgi:hypothetical protein
VIIQFVSQHHIERHIHKHETEFVDRVEFRLIFNDQVCARRTVYGAQFLIDFILQLWAEWVVPGDSMSNAPTDVVVNSPFFNTTMEGGWFKPNRYTINTLPGVDGAFAIMLSHLCCTEYSVAAIKKDLNPGTPAHPPSSWAWGAGAMNLQYGGRRTQGELVLKW